MAVRYAAYLMLLKPSIKKITFRVRKITVCTNHTYTILLKKKENNTNFLHQTDHLWMIPLSGFCLMAGEEDMVEKHFLNSLL